MSGFLGVSLFQDVNIFIFIFRDLDLKRPIYQKTAVYGHFGRADFSWECAKKLVLEIA